MILVTGATGCVGRAVVERLTSSGHQVKCLWRWGHEHPAPRRVVITGGDVRNVDSLNEALTEGGKCDTVIHLASLRRETAEEKFESINEIGTANVIMACKGAKINRLITVGCLGAETRSPYPLQRSLGKAEEIIRGSGLNFTVLKSAVVCGPGDWLTNWLTGIAQDMPLVMPIPHSGSTKLQPIWVEDLAACVERCLSVRSTFRQIVPVGGPQSLTLHDLAQHILAVTVKKRRVVRVPSAFTNQLSNWLRRCSGALNETELDALIYNRTTEIGGIHRVFGFAPAKIPSRLSYLAPHYEPPSLPVNFRY